MSRAVAEARRVLNRFEFVKSHPWDSGRQMRCWDDPTYTLKPRNFSVRLIEIRPSVHPHGAEDVKVFLEAVKTLVDVIQATPKRRKVRK